MKRKTTPPRQATAPATDESADAATTVARGLERCLEHLAAVMPGLPQLGIAMILLSVAIAASQALQAPADSGSDAVSASTPGPEAGFDEAPF